VEQREAAADAEPDDADFAGAVVGTGEVVAGGADVGECAAVPAKGTVTLVSVGDLGGSVG
jgi:hypothetical protein